MHTIRNTTMDQVPGEILKKTAHIAKPAVRLAICCHLLNQQEIRSHKGPFGMEFDVEFPASGHAVIDEAVEEVADLAQDMGYTDAYYHGGWDPDIYEFSMKGPSGRRKKIQGGDEDELAANIRAWHRELGRRAEEHATEFMYVMTCGGGIKERYEAGTLDADLSKILGVGIRVRPGRSGERLFFSKKGPRIKRAVQRAGGIDAVAAALGGERDPLNTGPASAKEGTG